MPHALFLNLANHLIELKTSALKDEPVRTENTSGQKKNYVRSLVSFSTMKQK